MALAFAILSPPLTPFGNSRQLASRVAPNLLFSKVSGEKRNSLVVAKAVGDSSESSSGSIVKSVQTAWSSPEDRLALAGLGFAGLVYIWAARNLISAGYYAIIPAVVAMLGHKSNYVGLFLWNPAVDKLPLLPSFFECIGILYSSWFVYRYLLFKPDREELGTIIKNSISRITGQ